MSCKNDKCGCKSKFDDAAKKGCGNCGKGSCGNGCGHKHDDKKDHKCGGKSGCGHHKPKQ